MGKINQYVEEKIVSELKMSGLSTYAARLYLALLSHPSTSASFLCKETGISDTKIYYALNELSRKEMIAVQKETPKIYRPLSPEEALNNLKQKLIENFDQKIAQIDKLADSLSPMFANSEGREEMELAYVIRGRRSIIRKMKDLMNSAKKEVLVFVSKKDLFDELKPFVMKETKRVKTELAVTREVWKTINPEESGQVRILACTPIDLVISDMKTLIIISSWKKEVAIMTNDNALMTLASEYYTNPNCCQKPTEL